MYCPACGIEERGTNQFCRACGTDLRPVRFAVQETDSITASAVSARDEVGKALAARIRDIRSPEEWVILGEEVLPQIEKFLESPEQKRLRRMRVGMIVASVGLGTAIGVGIASIFMNDPDVLFIAALGLVTFFLGLGFILNGIYLTVPKEALPDRSPNADSQRELDSGTTNELKLPGAENSVFTSVTEHTTKHLKGKGPKVRS